jgi:hypothetical protein
MYFHPPQQQKICICKEDENESSKIKSLGKSFGIFHVW